MTSILQIAKVIETAAMDLCEEIRALREAIEQLDEGISGRSRRTREQEEE